jgi:hypothetical protein
MVQQQAWMAYSCSSYFSDQFSYRTLFISKYGLKDMIYTRYTHFLEFLQNKKKGKTFLTQAVLAAVADTRDRTPRGAAQSDVARVEPRGTAGGFSQKAGTAG